MKLTLKQKREFIKRFIAGEPSMNIVFSQKGGGVFWGSDTVFRSYLRGEFKLKPKKRGLK